MKLLFPLFYPVMRLVSFSVLTLVFWGWIMAGSLAAEPFESSPIRWVGSMFPAGQSSTTVGVQQPLTIFTQVYQPHATEETGQGQQLECDLLWSEVDEFGGIWNEVNRSPMVYSGDIGNNDEYQGSISAYTGLYEFTTRCTDTRTGQALWQQDGNGRLVVSPLVGRTLDRRALWVEKSHIDRKSVV